MLTGASGFVGGHLIDELSKTYELHAVSTKKKSIQGIARVYNWGELELINDTFYGVVHLAGLAHDTSNTRKESEYFEVNRDLTARLVKKAKDWEITSFIYLSSVKASVDSTSDIILTEDVSSEAKQVYGRSKLAGEQEILKNTEDFKKVILRPVMIYGKGQKGNLKSLEKFIIKRLPFPFKHWRNRRSMLYIGNLTSTITQILRHPIDSGVYFIADDQATSTVELLKYIGNGLSTQPRFIGIPNSVISAFKKVLPGKLDKLADKLLGSLEVDTTKLKTALKIKQMPYSTEQGFTKLYSKP